MFSQPHPWVLWGIFAAAPLTLLATLLITAPYGRHARSGWGPALNARLAWILMESPSVWAFTLWFVAGDGALTLPALVFFGMWQLHYFNRVVIYGLRMRPAKPTPVVIATMALVFNLANSHVNGVTIASGRYDVSWLWRPAFLAGTAIFLLGWSINIWADGVLRRLRKPGETGYKIPRGGLYESISCPNYFGEILEWCGWAIATWSPAGLAMAIYTAANLVPRAISHHRWYKQTFPDYPSQRRAVFPGLL